MLYHQFKLYLAIVCEFNWLHCIINTGNFSSRYLQVSFSDGCWEKNTFWIFTSQWNFNAHTHPPYKTCWVIFYQNHLWLFHHTEPPPTCIEQCSMILLSLSPCHRDDFEQTGHWMWSQLDWIHREYSSREDRTYDVPGNEIITKIMKREFKRGVLYLVNKEHSLFWSAFLRRQMKYWKRKDYRRL